MAHKERLEEKKKYVRCDTNTISDTQTPATSDTFEPLGVDNHFDLESFKRDFKINVLKVEDDEMVFEMIGIDAPLANAFRRILIAEVPTMAIDQVYMYNNTSVIQDEVLAHRLGLVPIKVDPRVFDFKGDEDEVSENNTLVFKLQVECTLNPRPTDPAGRDKYLHSEVYSRDLKGDPSTYLNGEAPVCVNDDILLAKLRPGQAIDLEAHCFKGIGKVHAKWSPVATASYRLLPEIRFLQPIVNKEADELVARCPMKVFDIEDLGSQGRKAVVSRPRQCTMCRECIREPPLSEKIRLLRVRDHFIFSIESTGALPARVLFEEAVRVLQDKATTAKQLLDAAINPVAAAAAAAMSL